MSHPGAGSPADSAPDVLAVFEDLYRNHGGRMKSLAYQLLRNTADAEDAIQETFLRAYRGMAGFRGGSSFSTWCYRVLFNTCRDMMRHKRSKRRNPEEEWPGDHVLRDVSSNAGDHALRLTLERCVAALPFRSRAVFLLFEVEGFKHREISRILEIPEGTSKTLLFEAKKGLQKAMWLSGGRESR